MVRRLRRAVPALAATAAGLALVAGACDDSATTEPRGEDNDGSRPAYSLVSVWLTDAPGDIAEAWVQIDAIYLQGRAADEDDDDSNGDGNGNGAHAGRVYLLEEPTGWINLIELDGETMTLVEGVMVPQGTYKQLRYVLGEALLLTEDGMAYATSGVDLDALNGVRTGMDPIEEVDGKLHCPSCSQSGLKVKAPSGGFEISDAGEIMMLDFDASESFGHSAGKSGRWIMHPVIKISEVDGDTSDGDGGGL